MSNDIAIMANSGTKFVAGTTAVLGISIVVLSLYYFFVSAPAKEIFEDVVIKTLLPIFNTLIAAILGWAFGKPLVKSLAERIKSSHGNQ